MLAGGRGAIVNTSSLSGLLGEENHLAYACSKAALLAFTRHVANMHGAHGIRCNAVAPGLMLTDIAIERLSERQLKAFRSERLLDNAARPEDVANLVVFLVSDQAAVHHRADLRHRRRHDGEATARGDAHVGRHVAHRCVSFDEDEDRAASS